MRSKLLVSLLVSLLPLAAAATLSPSHSAPRAAQPVRRAEEPRAFRLIRTLTAHRDGFRALALNGDGTLLASAAGYYGAPEEAGLPDENVSRGEVKLWDVQAGKLRSRLAPVEQDVHTAALSLKGDLLLTGGTETTLWEVASGKPRSRWESKDPAVMSAAFHPSGDRFAVGLENGGVELRAATDARVLRTVSGISAPIIALAFSPDGRSLAAVFDPSDGNQSRATNLVCWNAETGAVRWKAAGEYQVVSLAWSPRGDLLATGGDDLELWDAATGKHRKSFPFGGGTTAVVFCSRRWLVAGTEGGAVLARDLENGRQSNLGFHDGGVLALAASGNGKVLVSGGADRRMRFWSVASRPPRKNRAPEQPSGAPKRRIVPNGR